MSCTGVQCYQNVHISKLRMQVEQEFVYHWSAWYRKNFYCEESKTAALLRMLQFWKLCWVLLNAKGFSDFVLAIFYSTCSGKVVVIKQSVLHLSSISTYSTKTA